MGYLYSPASRCAKRGDGCSGPVPAATPPRPRDGAGSDESNLSIVVLECKAIRESAGRKLPPRRHTSGRAHARAETREARRSVGPALDHLDLVDNALGVAVRGLLVEVGEELGAPEPDAAPGGSGRRRSARRAADFGSPGRYDLRRGRSRRPRSRACAARAARAGSAPPGGGCARRAPPPPACGRRRRPRDELAAVAVLGLVERQPPRWPRRATRLKLGARREHEVGWIRVRSSESLRSDRANRGSRVAVRLEIADYGLPRASSASEVEVV
jgi:hypothetical protein